MLNNPVKRETVKGVGAVGAVVAQDPVADVLVIVLGIAVEALGTFSQKRSKELFDSDDLKEGVVRKIKESDDFASFVLSVWQKHNLESNEDRRRLLKRFLEEEVYKKIMNLKTFLKLNLFYKMPVYVHLSF